MLIYPYVVAEQAIEAFRCRWINPEFGSGPFAFPAGAVLAVDEPQLIYIDRETFQPISSCFVLVPNGNIPPNEWRVDASEDKVQISVNPALRERIGNARSNKKNRAILLNSIYFGAVAQCLTLLREGDQVAEQRWAKIFRQRLSDQHLDLDAHHECWLAQQLMRHPFAIVDRYFFVEGGE